MPSVLLKRLRRLPAVSVLSGLSLVLLALGGGVASANGGTAKPPPPPPRPAPRLGLVSRVFPPLQPPKFTAADPGQLGLHAFNVVGFIQDMTVSATDSDCPGLAKEHWGGTVVVNSLTIIVPCNSVIQLPANTKTWSDFVNPTGPALKVTLKQLSATTGTVPVATVSVAPSPSSSSSVVPTATASASPSPSPSPSPVVTPGTFPSFEINVIGNTVAGRHIAGLITVSQQAANLSQGIITSIDYDKGQLHVGSGLGAPDQAVVEINDPLGRFGLKHSPDERFSVDEENPTIHAMTGYPMCVPRTDPKRDPVTGVLTGLDDPLCPQQNRPAPVANHCRDFIDDGLGDGLPKGGNLVPPIGNPAFCGHFVMPPVAAPTAPPTTPASPDPTKQAPFEVGDYITYAGTLLSPPDTAPSLISAHTIEASVGIFTSHGTKPSYLAIGAFGVGSADPNAVAVNGAKQETANRIFLETETSDVTTPVDIYLPDVDPAGGAVSYRWITPFDMTGESNPEFTGTTTPGAFIGGGIKTQFNGVQSQRVRLRASKAPLGLLNSPTRNILVVNRTLCNPDTTGTPSSVGANSTVNNIKDHPDCLTSQIAANGLASGRYQAPNFNFIFPENVQKGDPVVPNDLWDLGFLSNGEGGAGGQGPLTPTPW